MVLVHLPLEWNTCLLFNSDIVNVVWKAVEKGREGAESIILLIFVLWHCFNRRWIVRWGRKSYLGPAEIASFPSRDLS